MAYYTAMAPGDDRAPTTLARSEHELRSADGTRLHLRHATLAQPRALVLMVHGYGEHSGRYEHVLERLGASGFRVAAGDLRGHGRSDGPRGHVERFEHYVDDVEAIVEHLRRQDALRERLPLVLIGHSLGGLVTLRYVQRHARHVDGFALVAPFLGLIFPVPLWKRGLAKVMSTVWPRYSEPTELPTELLSHDPAWVENFETDPLVFHHATARWFTETQSAQRLALSGAESQMPPMLLMLAGQDRMVSNDAARRIHAALGAPEDDVCEYPDFFHDMLHEVDNERLVDDIARWIQERILSKAG